MSCHVEPQFVGKETQNRNKFNAVSHTLVHSTLPSPPLLSSRHPPRRSFFRFSTHIHKASTSQPSFLYTPYKSPMLLTSFAFLVCASASALAQQVVYDTAHNVTPITGTWSSGSMNVWTGTVRMFMHLPLALIHYREMV